MNKRQALNIIRQFEWDPKLNYLLAAIVELQKGQPPQKYTDALNCISILLTNLQEFDKIHSRILSSEDQENEVGRHLGAMAER